jgi:methylglutaconyl-CoA hydratase
MAGADPLVRVTVSRGISTVTLDSPDNRNALSGALITQLLDRLATAATDDTVRVVVLTHTGPAFCSGADLKETASGQLPAARLGDVLAAVVECPKPVVARVAGPARAGGVGLVAAADVVLCAQDVTFAFSEVRLGVIPAVISATVLPLLAPRAAAELMLTGEPFDARRAAEVGLVTAAVPAGELDATVDRYCAALVRGAPKALAATKQLLRRPRAATVREDVGALTELSVGFFLSDEGREGVTAYREKRDPYWVP